MKTLYRLYQTKPFFALLITGIGFLLYAVVLLLIIIFFVVVFTGT
jgi:hypothetical protein